MDNYNVIIDFMYYCLFFGLIGLGYIILANIL